MNIKEILNSILEEYNKGRCERKIRIIKYVACCIILLLWIIIENPRLSEYFNDVRFLPRLPEFLRDADSILFIILAGATFLIVRRIIFINFIVQKDNETKVRFGAICNCVEFIISIRFLLYSVNLVLEYFNDTSPNNIYMHIAYIFSTIYLVVCIVTRVYFLYIAEHANDMYVYTDYFDANGDRIREGAAVCYNGKLYHVKNVNNNIKLCNAKMRGFTDEWIDIENIISDCSVIIVNNK